MKRRILMAVAAVVVVLVGVAAWTFWPRGTNEVSEEEALDDFRDRAAATTSTAADTDDPSAIDAASIPAPGVYTFAATGQETVKLGPLPAQDRPFPDSITAIVVDQGDGCFDLTLNLFAEHTEDTRYCTADGTLTLDSHTKHQQIAALSPTATMTCDPSTLVSDDETSHDLTCSLSMSGGPASITADLVGTAERGPAEERTVGSDTVEATPVTISYEVSGDLSGTWTETLWLTESNLPVRIERDLELSGLANFTEQSELDLTSLTPTT